MLLVLTVFAVERWLAFTESERWRSPALMALNAYVFAADRVGRLINDRMLELVRELPSHPHEPRLNDALVFLLAQPVTPAGDGPVHKLAVFARDETSALTITAAVMADMVARHQAFAWVVKTIAQEQQRLADIADRLNGMSRMLAGPARASDPKWSNTIERQTTEVFSLMQTYLEVLNDLRALEMEAPRD